MNKHSRYKRYILIYDHVYHPVIPCHSCTGREASADHPGAFALAISWAIEVMDQQQTEKRRQNHSAGLCQRLKKLQQGLPEHLEAGQKSIGSTAAWTLPTSLASNEALNLDAEASQK